MSILMSHMMVTKTPQNVHRKCFWTILVAFIFDLKIDINMCEHILSIYFFLWTSSIVQMVNFLTFDIFLATWHLFWHFDTCLTTWAHGQHMWSCAGSCVQLIMSIPTRFRWGTGVMGHMGIGVHGYNFFNTAWIFTKILTGHRYWCILSKYKVICPQWLDLKELLMDLKFTDWFQLPGVVLRSNIGSIDQDSCLISLVLLGIFSNPLHW